MAVVKGGDLMLFLESGSESNLTKKSIAFATNHTLIFITKKANIHKIRLD